METQYNLKKWAAIIKECRSSGMKILKLLEINNISKGQYYYWQRKLKETCIDTKKYKVLGTIKFIFLLFNLDLLCIITKRNIKVLCIEKILSNL